MWYSRKIESSWEQFNPVSTCLCPKYIKFCFRNLENVREEKNGNRCTFGFNNETKCPVHFAKIALYFIFGTKSSLSTSVFIFSNIYQILKTKFYIFWTQTCRNLKSIKFANFLISHALK